MNKYIGLIKEMYNNRVLLHNPIQIADSNMPTEILEILSISNGIEEVITFKDRKEAIGWILYSYEMIKSDTEFYKAEYVFSSSCNFSKTSSIFLHKAISL